MPSDEVRVVDPSGAMKGSKGARYDLVPVEPLDALARHYGVGAEKYEAHNWKKGFKWSLSYAALQRHLQAWWGGETYDQETGTHHLTSVAWHAFGLFWFQLYGVGTDDRPVRPLDKQH